MDKGDYFGKDGEIRCGSGVFLAILIYQVEYIKTKYFRLIPKQNLNQNEDDLFNSNVRFPRFYSIDGERYPIEPIQGRVLNKRLRVFCINNKI